jgi:hypothetical protein
LKNFPAGDGKRAGMIGQCPYSKRYEVGTFFYFVLSCIIGTD